MLSTVIQNGKYPTIAIHFTPLKDFESDETRSHYVTHLADGVPAIYHIRPGNERLHDLVFGENGKGGKGSWLGDKKVAIVGSGGTSHGDIFANVAAK